MTGDAFQPVRLYYAIPDRASVTRKLGKLGCMTESPRDDCWEWLFKDEAASLRFSGGFDDVPAEKRPIVIGRLRFPAGGRMTFETNAIPRAIEGARFFGPRLGSGVVAMRCRLVNRWFSADEGPPGALMKTLDRGVTVADPREAEAKLKREFAGVRTKEDAERAAADFMKRQTESGDDVPDVEDFPLYPEEETPDFLDLANCLHLRFIRAAEHWRGNTHLTLNAIIQRTFQESPGDRRSRGACTSWTAGGTQEPLRE